MKVLDERENPTKDKILSFLQLSPKWHFGEGVPPSQEIVNEALMIANQATLSTFNTDSFPGIDGEIMVTVYHKEHYLEFTVETDGSVTFFREKNNQELSYRENIPFNVAIEELDRFSEEIWKNISELFTQNILIPQETNLRASPFVIPLDQESRSFLKIVSYQAGDPYVNISTDITSEYPQFQPFSGSSPSRNYQKMEIGRAHV